MPTPNRANRAEQRAARRGFYLSPEPVKCPGHAYRPCEDNPADPCRNCYDARRTQ